MVLAAEPTVTSPEHSYNVDARGAEIPRRVTKGRLAPLRRQLLLALPPGRVPGRGGRHNHQPHRVSLHHPLNRARARLGREAGDAVTMSVFMNAAGPNFGSLTSRVGHLAR